MGKIVEEYMCYWRAWSEAGEDHDVGNLLVKAQTPEEASYHCRMEIGARFLGSENHVHITVTNVQVNR